MPTIRVPLAQVGASAMQATIREHSITTDRPEAKGGSNQGPMGGELLLAAYGGCFASNLLAAISARNSAVSNVAITVEGELEGTPSRFTSMTLVIGADYEDRAELEKLITIAERGCIVHNSLKDGVQLGHRIMDTSA